jgi:type III pantothenate kinase
MLLAIDIGNSNVVIGVYSQDNWSHIWRLPTLLTENPLLYYQEKLQNLLLENGLWPVHFEKVVVSCVVPELRKTFATLTLKFLKKEALIVGPKVYRKLHMEVVRPEELGSDLYANAFAANALYQQDTIIVDFGTALTFTIVDAHGELKGVNIAPGLKTAIHALFLKTAQLPEVPLEYPASVVGQNTTHAIQAGIMVGYVGLVKHTVEAIRNELGDSYQAIATGGLVKVLTPLHSFFDAIQPNLTLDGLRLIADQYEG